MPGTKLSVFCKSSHLLNSYHKSIRWILVSPSNASLIIIKLVHIHGRKFGKSRRVERRNQTSLKVSLLQSNHY